MGSQIDTQGLNLGSSQRGGFPFNNGKSWVWLVPIPLNALKWRKRKNRSWIFTVGVPVLVVWAAPSWLILRPRVKSQCPLVDAPAGMRGNKYMLSHWFQLTEYQEQARTCDALKVILFTQRHSRNVEIWRITLESHLHANNIDFGMKPQLPTQIVTVVPLRNTNLVQHDGANWWVLLLFFNLKYGQ